MGSFVDKKTSEVYKDLIHLNNSNSGLDPGGTIVQDGNGTDSILKLGTTHAILKPSSNHSASFLVEDSSGNDVLRTDTTNKLVKVNETQSIANTQYLRFGAKDINVDSGTHIGVPIAGMGANAAVTFGTGADPTTPTLSNNLDDVVHYLHYVDTNITIDAVRIMHGATTATGDTVDFHLIALTTPDGTTVDEFSGATIVADQSSGSVNAGYEQFYSYPLDIQSANIDSGNYLALTIEGNGTNSDYSVNALIRYHLR